MKKTNKQTKLSKPVCRLSGTTLHGTFFITLVTLNSGISASDRK